MNPSSARIAASRGKALNDVLTARKRMSAVLSWNTTNNGEPAPKTAVATWAIAVGPPSLVGWNPKATPTTAIPMKMTARRTAMIDIVLAAFFDSGGLNAGTPLAMASTPVRATDPPANARNSSRSVTGSSGFGGAMTSGGAGIGTTVPDTIRARPSPTIRSAIPTKRYVGTAKMLPDSRRPRRFASVMSVIETIAISIRKS
jgi:hypothetical protein